MRMKPEFYSVEELAVILDLHPKTVQRFIREGKIRGRKIGRAWKVHSEDLKEFAHAELLNPVDERDFPTEGFETVRVSVVVELREKDADEASRISNSVIAMLNCKDPAWGPTRYDLIYDPEARKARYLFYGSPGFIREIMGLFDIIRNNEEIES